jgi:hypothetical protein
VFSARVQRLRFWRPEDTWIQKPLPVVPLALAGLLAVSLIFLRFPDFLMLQI